jgi:hypothetical protein
MPIRSDIPQKIKDVGFDFDWDEKKVWQLEERVVAMPIAELAWHFDIPFCDDGERHYCLTPREIMANPSSYKAEYERTLKADLNFPIDIMRNKSRWLILDGLHRLMKAHLDGAKTVRVRKIPRERIPEITK